MHIPDGFLDTRICLATGAISAAAVGGSLRRVRPDAEPGLGPRMGLTAAYVFAAQMVNFPVAAGTSGHLLGALLASVLLGPSAASVVMAAVFLVQAFFFADGGYTALGANVLNMGLAGTYGGYAVYRALAGPAPGARRCLWAAGTASWVSVMLGATLCAAELALSGTVPARLVFPAMLGVHAFIGLGEAAITAAALGLLWKVRPDLLTGRDGGKSAGARWGWAAGAGLALVAALAPLASSAPDGLEWVAGALGFQERGPATALRSPFPDYHLPGLEKASWAPVLVGLLGAGIMVGTMLVLARSLRLGRRSAEGGAAVGTGSPLACLDARMKLGCALGLVLVAVLLPGRDAGKLWLLLFFAAAWVAAARARARWLAGRALLLLPFVGLAALSLPAFRSGGGPGLSLVGLAFLRAGISLLTTAAFVTTTPEGEILTAMSAYRLPRALGETIAFALRYLRVLAAEATRMVQARTSRSGGSGTLALRAEAAGGIVGSLFIRSFERAERVSLAMAARGYRGDGAPPELEACTAADCGFALGLALLLLGVWLWP
jgi:cobalt/nickel transport system permease protein